MTRLDKIEHEAREVAKYMEGVIDMDRTATGDILALVAVARIAVESRVEGWYADDRGWDRMDAALAPLLESTAPRQGKAL